MMPAWFVLLACGRLLSEPATDTDAIFPHGDGYDTWSGHGADARRIGVDACNACHGIGLAGEPCAKCHEGWPHIEGWISGTQHGVGLTGLADRSDCEKCHDVVGSAANTDASCTSCHPSWPHPTDWEANHGAYTLARSVSACVGCHGPNGSGTPTAPACASCHATFPHPADWVEISHPIAAHADLASCDSCHGVGGTGGVSGVACARCHPTYPHPADWKTTHHDTAARGERPCLACHDAGFGPPLPPATCAPACHGGAR